MAYLPLICIIVLKSLRKWNIKEKEKAMDGKRKNIGSKEMENKKWKRERWNAITREKKGKFVS